MHDIVFEQHYSRNITARLEAASKNAARVGRQQGWTDAIHVLHTMQDLGIEVTVDNFIGVLQQTILGTPKNEEVTQDSASANQRPTLSVVSLDA